MKNKKKKVKKLLKKLLTNRKVFDIIYKSRDAGMAQSVEHVIGNDEVISSILITSSKIKSRKPFKYKGLRDFFRAMKTAVGNFD